MVGKGQGRVATSTEREIPTPNPSPQGAHKGEGSRPSAWQDFRFKRQRKSKRLHLDDAGDGFDRAGDLRRDLEAARQLDLDLGASAEHQHH
jgi:hypothetical protein